MAIELVPYLSQRGEAPRAWIDFDAYTKKLLLAKGENPWTTPAAYTAYYSQAVGLVKADVAAINFWDLCAHWMQEDAAAIPSMAGRSRPTVALKTMLETVSLRELLAEVIVAINNNFGTRLPLVLVMPSPRSLLIKAHAAANQVVIEPTESHIDTAAMYCADFIRYYSETPLSGILLEESPDSLPAGGEELSWYQPIFNVAKHYRWSVGLNLPSDQECDIPDGIDFVISPGAQGEHHKYLGKNITQELWDENAEVYIPDAGFVYLSIPEDIRPESVLDTLASVKS